MDYEMTPTNFNLHWDNDIVSLTREDVAELIPLMIHWMNKKWD